MKLQTKFQKLFVGGFASIALMTAVACSGFSGADIPTVELEPTAAPVADVIDSDIATPADVITSIEIASESPHKEDTGTSGESIHTAFEGEDDATPTGDAIPEPSPTAPAISAEPLTAEEIVAAQGQHLANLYERTVQSIVFIKTNVGLAESSGSGFVWDEEGHIVTNYHVIQNATQLIVKFFNGREYKAEVVAFDPDSDLAIIKVIEPEHELVPIEIGNSSNLRPGEMAIALGNPFGEEFTMTTGIVSAVSRTLSSGFSLYRIPAVIQTDTAINPGNSGGPLLDMHGKVVGVNTQIRSESRQSSGVGFAVPVDLVKRVIPSLIEKGQHTYALMGISGNEVNITVRENAELPGDIMGAIVMSTTPDGPAALAGILADTGTRSESGFITHGLENWDGDIIISINSVRMKSMDDLIAYLALNTAPGDEILVGVYRDGLERVITLTLGARPVTS